LLLIQNLQTPKIFLRKTVVIKNSSRSEEPKVVVVYTLFVLTYLSTGIQHLRIT